MKDKLLYLTIGLLIGIVVMQWTMPTGQASGVFPVNGIVASTGNGVVLDQNGRTWTIYSDGSSYTWREEVDPQGVAIGLPVPVSEVKFWEGSEVVTTENVIYCHTYDFATSTWHWVNCGPWPGGPVPTLPETWGGVKGKYEGNN